MNSSRGGTLGEIDATERKTTLARARGTMRAACITTLCLTLRPGLRGFAPDAGLAAPEIGGTESDGESLVPPIVPIMDVNQPDRPTSSAPESHELTAGAAGHAASEKAEAETEQRT